MRDVIRCFGQGRVRTRHRGDGRRRAGRRRRRTRHAQQHRRRAPHRASRAEQLRSMSVAQLLVDDKLRPAHGGPPADRGRRRSCAARSPGWSPRAASGSRSRSPARRRSRPTARSRASCWSRATSARCASSSRRRRRRSRAAAQAEDELRAAERLDRGAARADAHVAAARRAPRDARHARRRRRSRAAQHRPDPGRGRRRAARPRSPRTRTSPSSTRTLLPDLERVGEHITAHGKRLMQLARPGPDHVEPIDLNAMVSDVIAMLRGAGKLRRARGRHELGPEPAAIVTVNRTRIEQILVNLDRSTPSTRSATGPATITIDVRPSERRQARRVRGPRHRHRHLARGARRRSSSRSSRPSRRTRAPASACRWRARS